MTHIQSENVLCLTLRELVMISLIILHKLSLNVFTATANLSISESGFRQFVCDASNSSSLITLGSKSCLEKSLY